MALPYTGQGVRTTANPRGALRGAPAGPGLEPLKYPGLPVRQTPFSFIISFRKQREHAGDIKESPAWDNNQSVAKCIMVSPLASEPGTGSCQAMLLIQRVKKPVDVSYMDFSMIFLIFS